MAKTSRTLITGARGFIGSAFARKYVGSEEFGHLRLFARDQNQNTKARLEHAIPDLLSKAELVYGDLCGDISGLCQGVDTVINFAAHTFVDHSIKDPSAFVDSNILGTAKLLEEARRHDVKRFLQVSTDEVYGEATKKDFVETQACSPRNPYSASKAAAEMMVMSYGKTYGMWVAITRTENNYGIMQHRRNALPAFIKRAYEDMPILIYGDGRHSRCWLHVSDHIDGIKYVLENSPKSGEIWNIGGGKELTTIQLARTVLSQLGKNQDALEFIDDSIIRPGHDRRYSMDCTKIQSIGWKPKLLFDNNISNVIDWYLENKSWLHLGKSREHN